MPGIVAMLSTMLLGLGALVSLPSSAHAAEVNVVKSIEMKNLYNKDGATKTKLWDTFRVNFTVDTTGTGAKAGDTFTVKLPDSLRTNVTSFPMYAKDGKTEVAKCEVPGGDGQTLTCTFGDYITSHPDMTGGGWVQAAVSKHKDVKKFTFMVPGGQISKDVPGGYVDPGRPRDLPKKAAKDGWPEASVSPSLLYWSIKINASGISGQQNVDIVDKFDTSNGGYKLDDNPGRAPRLLKWNSASDYTSGKDPALSVAAGQAVNNGTFTFTPSETGYKASWPNSDPNAVYELRYFTQLKDPSQAKPGVKFKNEAQVNGETYAHTSQLITFGEGQLDGVGRGSVSVKKASLEGDGANYVDKAKQYEVTATYSVGGVDRSEKLVLTAGGEAKTLRSLPVGTKVTLSEITPVDPEFKWGKPVFSSSDPNVKVSQDGSSAVVTVGEKATAKVMVTNRVTAPSPKVDIVKKDSKGNDANTSNEAVDLRGSNGSTQLTFKVTNNGTETLTDVKVTDSVTAGKAKVDNLSCTFPDGTKGTTWAGPFAPGVSFPCTADLSGVTAGDPHADRANVEGKGKFTGKPVSDHDTYNAKVNTPQKPAPGAPGAPTVSPSTLVKPTPPVAPTTMSPTPTASISPSPSPTTASPSPTASLSPTASPSPTASSSPTASLPLTASPSPTATQSATASPTAQRPTATSGPAKPSPSTTAKPSKPSLPRTGAKVLGLGIVALVAIAGGAALILARRKKN